jgi:hypothetical protein
MSEIEIRDYSTAKGFHPQTLERWLSWQPDDAGALAGLAIALKISENHLRDRWTAQSRRKLVFTRSCEQIGR